MLNNFWLWSHRDFLPSETVADPALSEAKPELILSFNNKSGVDAEGRLKAAFFESGMESFFSRIEFLYLSLEGDRDLYIRDYSLPPPQEGFKAGPNNQFFDTVAYLKHLSGPVFLMETDCVPIRSGWLDALQRTIDGSSSCWIVGSIYRGKAHLPVNFARHVNGNALYAVHDPAFHRFVETVWRPRLRQVASEHDPTVAYDTFIEIMISNGMHNHREDDYRLFQDLSSKIAYTSVIQNHSTDLDESFFEEHCMSDFLHDHTDTYILHGVVFARAVSQLRVSSAQVRPENLYWPIKSGVRNSHTLKSKGGYSETEPPQWSYLALDHSAERAVKEVSMALNILRSEHQRLKLEAGMLRSRLRSYEGEIAERQKPGADGLSCQPIFEC